MIDHLLKFTDETSAKAALPAYAPLGDDGQPAWRGDCVLPALSVYRVTGMTTQTDPETGATYDVEQRETVPGYYLCISAMAQIADLRAMPECRIIADRDTATIIHVASDADRDLIETARIEPLFAGSNYQFGETGDI